MELVIKFYANQFSTTITRQVQDVLGCSIEFDINNYGTADVIIPLIEGINKFDKIEIYEVKGEDELVFTGYIWDFKAGINEIQLFCRTTKSLMNNKLVLSDKTYSSKTISYIINDLLADWNTAYSETWTFFCADTTVIPDKDFSEGDDLYAILDELSGSLGLVWDIYGTEIKVLPILGTDRTSGLGYSLLLFNGLDPYSSNISNPEVQTYDSLRNVIIGSDGTSKSIKSDATSITANGAIGEYKTFRKGDLANSTQLYLDSKKVEQKVFTFDLNEYNGNVGDKVKLIIENANTYLNFSGDVLINKQSITYNNRTKTQKFGVSDVYVYYDTIQNRLGNIEKNLKLNSL